MHTNTDFILSLLNTASRVERRLDRALSAVCGVSFTEYHLLNQLQVKLKGSATRVDLAAAVGLTPSAITRALKPLEKIGLVETVKSERDARRSLATLTNAGESVLDNANAVVQDEIEQFKISGDDKALVLAALESIR